MIEAQVRALFMEIADGEPDPPRVDTGLAHRRGRARLRWRRASLAGAPVLAAVAVAALVVAGVPFRPGPGPATGGPGAPRQFNPLVPYLSFGWLPAGESLVWGGTSRQDVWVAGGRTLASPLGWSVSVDAAGKCQLIARATELSCSTTAQKGNPIKITGRAPAVRGHRAYWAGPYLLWPYARDGWAELTLPEEYRGSPRKPVYLLPVYRREAVKIADHLRYGAATPPLLFPVQLTHLPSRWRVTSLTYEPYAGVLRVRTYALGAGPPNLGADGGLVYETGLPYFLVDPISPRALSCYVEPHHSTVKVINGYRVVLTNEIHGIPLRHDLCTHARGLALNMTVFAAHPSISMADLFGHHMRLLGANPANWTRKPIG